MRVEEEEDLVKWEENHFLLGCVHNNSKSPKSSAGVHFHHFTDGYVGLKKFGCAMSDFGCANSNFLIERVF